MLANIGLGNSSVAAMHNMAMAASTDGAASAVHAFSQLGTSGAWPQNVERDLHRWVRNLHGLQLEPHWIAMDLLNSVTLEVESTLVPCIAPHELVAAPHEPNFHPLATPVPSPGVFVLCFLDEFFCILDLGPKSSPVRSQVPN
jgi:hypothetical protein